MNRDESLREGGRVSGHVRDREREIEGEIMGINRLSFARQ